jgi:hypothetical protein
LARNQKLTSLIQGRTITGTTTVDPVLTVQFDDGSLMTVETDGTAITIAEGGTVAAVRQADTTLQLEFEDGSMLDIETAEETSCVMVRDRSHVMEYSD